MISMASAALMYVLVPMPCLFFGGGSTHFLTSREGGGWVFLYVSFSHHGNFLYYKKLSISCVKMSHWLKASCGFWVQPWVEFMKNAINYSKNYLSMINLHISIKIGFFFWKVRSWTWLWFLELRQINELILVDLINQWASCFDSFIFEVCPVVLKIGCMYTSSENLRFKQLVNWFFW